MANDEQQIGKYHILEELGRGGFATVYKAVDTTLDREVAMKILDPLILRDPTFINRFKQEAKVMARLFHPNVATVFEISEADGRHFIAMQYIAGRNLRDLAREKGPLPFEQIVAIIDQIGAALDYAHAHDVIHRDVKPSNILIDERGHATLTDFGVAKALEGTNIQTTSGAVMGTPYYASPEQAESHSLDGRSDLYSLGIVAYELCTGDVPFKAESTPSLYYKIVHEPPRLPSDANARAAHPIEQVLLKAIARRPDQRYQSGQEFAAALRTAVTQLQELIVSLCEQASALLAGHNLDAAEDKLRRILAIDPGHSDAQVMLDLVGKRRTSSQRYEEIVGLVVQARRQAAELRRDDPNIPDPDGVLHTLIGHPDDHTLWPGAGISSETARRIRRLLRIIAIVLFAVGGVAAAFLGWYTDQLPEPTVYNTLRDMPKLDRQLYANDFLGLACGIGLSGLILLGLSFMPIAAISHGAAMDEPRQ
jgi:serine/threonine protein kinase